MARNYAATLMRVAVAGLALSASIATAELSPAVAQSAPEGSAALSNDYVLLTIFLKHDQSKPLDQINKELADKNWARDFPPAGVEVESWYIMMGVGQVVTLRVPPSKVREVNRIVEQKAWGPYRTEFYLTYDYKPTAKAAHEKALQAK